MRLSTNALSPRVPIAHPTKKHRVLSTNTIYGERVRTKTDFPMARDRSSEFVEKMIKTETLPPLTPVVVPKRRARIADIPDGIDVPDEPVKTTKKTRKKKETIEEPIETTKKTRKKKTATK